MAKAPLVKRRRGRPTAEEANAIATENAVLTYRKDVIRLLPKAVTTLEKLLDTGSEKVKEQTAKFIVEEVKEVYNLYTEEDNDDTEAGGTASASSATHSGVSSGVTMPLTTQIREYKMAEGED